MTVWHETYEPPGRDAPQGPVSPDDHGGRFDLSFFAGIGVTLGNLVEEMRRTNDRAQRLLDAIPGDAPVMGQGVTNGSGSCVIGCGGPSLSRQWQVRQLGVIGPTKGRVTIFACPAPPSASQVLGFKDTITTRWPAPAFYGTHQFIVNPSEQVWVVVETATDMVQVVIAGTAETYALSDLPVIESV